MVIAEVWQLAYFGTWGESVGWRYNSQGAVGVLGGEDHALRFYAVEFARGEVGYEAYLLTHEVLGLVEFGDARDDGAGAHTVVDEEAEQFVGFGNGLTFKHFAHAYVEFEERVEVDGSGLRFGLPSFEAVLLLDGGEAVELGLDGVVFDFFEEELRFVELGAGGYDVGLAEVVP